MKRLAMLALVVFGIFIALLTRSLGDAPDTIHLEGDAAVQAGESWTLRLSVDDGSAGENVDLTLFNGLIRIDDTLTLGSGGVAEWRSPRLTQAGQSLVSVRYHHKEVRQPLDVLPRKAVALDLFTTANTLPSYGAGLATIMILPHDEWGNPPVDHTPFQATALCPDATEKILNFYYRDSLGWALLRSTGTPGRIRIGMDEGQPAAAIEMLQSSGDPNTITLQLDPTCVLSDGRDVVLLTAFALDEQNNPVADGTLITFSWKDGFGYGVTAKGQAQLRLPAPQAAGKRGYTTASGQLVSDEVNLTIERETCANEP